MNVKIRSFIQLLIRTVVVTVAVLWVVGLPAGKDLSPARVFGAAQATSTPAPPAPTPSPEAPLPTALAGAPVELDGEVLFYISERVGSVTPTERAQIITSHLQKIASNPFAGEIQVQTVDAGGQTDVILEDTVLFSVTDQDAADNGKGRLELAEERAQIVQQALAKYQARFEARNVWRRILEILAVVVTFLVLAYLVNRLFSRMMAWVENWAAHPQRKNFIERTNLFASGQLPRLLLTLLTLGRLLAWVLLFFIILPLIFKRLPGMGNLADQISGALLYPLQTLWQSLVDYSPNLVFLLVVGLITWILIKIFGTIFVEIENETIKISGFSPEWARFTYRLVTFSLMIIALIVCYPHIPGAESDSFKAIAIFLGAVFSLSATTAVANAIAGIIITYTGSFRLGDVVQIGTVTGVVMEKTLLVMRIRTFKNELVSIPNSLVITSNLTNFSTQARQGGVILHTSVTIGYNASWRQVHDLLIAAALSTQDILPEPPPFVLQTSLNDFSITYELNAFTSTPERMPRLYSMLHQNIQDHFNQAGVEIMSPAYAALRDGNTVTIPPVYLPASYQPPGFKVDRPLEH